MNDKPPFHLPTLAKWCQGELSGYPQPSAASLFNYFDEIDFDAMTDVVAQPDFVVFGASSAERVARLERAGWKPIDHPNYVPRTLVYDAFEKFAGDCRDRGRGGAFVLKGAAGLGKTAIMTHWVSDQSDAARFYFRYRDGQVNSSTMRTALWNQLGIEYELEPVPVPAEDEYVGRLEERLRWIARNRLKNGTRLMLFVDALDEARDKEMAARLIPKSLPSGVFIIVSSRPSDTADDHLSALAADGAKIFTLEAKDNLPDVEKYLVRSLGGQLKGGVANILAHATGGSFMLATLYAEAVLQGKTTIAETIAGSRPWRDLTTGQRLNGYYQDCWKRACELGQAESPAGFRKALMEFAGLMLASFNWIGDRQAQQILQWMEKGARPRDRMWDGQTFSQVLAALDWMLERRTWEKEGYRGEFLGLRHHSMRDFLAAREGPLWFHDADMHAAIGRFYLDRAKLAGKWDWSKVDPYGRAYAIRHLLRSSSAEARLTGAEALASLDYVAAAIGDETLSEEAP